MFTTKIKPLSINKAFKGRRYKTKDYKEYESQVYKLLPRFEVPKRGRLKLEMVFGYSNSNNDIDNGIKLFVNVLQKKYGFNDNRIYELHVHKEIVKKGFEFIKWEIKKL